MHQCPVCLTDSLDEPYKRYSYDICPRCGVEFGYDDAINESGWTSEDWRTKADELLALRHEKLRQIWLDAGRPNWWEETEAPDFEFGVRWFKEYWKNHPLEEEEWQGNLSSIFKNIVKDAV